MIRQTAVEEHDRHESDGSEEYLIQLTIPREERDEQWELRRDIVRLGGIDAEDGFAFASEYERDHALEILIDRWGPWYFESMSVRDETLPRLLIAVSDPDQQVALGRFFRKHDFSVEVVGDALHALQMLAIHRPQALIVDKQLRWGGGDGLLSYVQEAPRYRSLRFIILGADRDRPPLAGGDRAVVACFGTSPQLDELLKAVCAAIELVPRLRHSHVS